MATIYLALLGRRGLRRLAEINAAKARYARDRFAAAGLRLPLSAPFFHEFPVVPRGGAREALARAREAGIVAGLALAPYAPELAGALLVCATELTTRAQIDRLAEVLAA